MREGIGFHLQPRHGQTHQSHRKGELYIESEIARSRGYCLIGQLAKFVGLFLDGQRIFKRISLCCQDEIKGGGKQKKIIQTLFECVMLLLFKRKNGNSK
jgi:hypothetical protein